MNLRRTVLALLSTALVTAAAHAQSLSATLLRDTLTVTVPYHAARNGTGKLTVELLDPDGKLLGLVTLHDLLRAQVSLGKQPAM